MSLLLPDSGLLFWMFVAFGVVFVILAKYGFPIIIKMVEGRKTYIDQSLRWQGSQRPVSSFEGRGRGACGCCQQGTRTNLEGGNGRT